MLSVLAAGLCVLDLVQRVTRAPGPDEKVTARSAELVAGGPATNAAVAAAVLGASVTLVTPLGGSPLAAVAWADLDRPGLTVRDLAVDDPTFRPNVSSVVVVEDTGERSVVSRDAAVVDEPGLLAATTAVFAEADPDIVLVDGHYPAVAMAVATWARVRGIPLVLDAGRWKPHFVDLLPLCDEVIASEAFTVPTGPVAAYAHARGVRVVAQTHGPKPIDVSAGGRVSRVEVPAVEAVDTLGAGDVLHGAYAVYRAAGMDAESSLRRAAAVAAFRCRFAGSRTWTTVWPDA
jgi:sugar/nucleoside kinase (ribokinase family)